jgi:hypothetical protein
VPVANVNRRAKVQAVHVGAQVHSGEDDRGAGHAADVAVEDLKATAGAHISRGELSSIAVFDALSVRCLSELSAHGVGQSGWPICA